jgi:hypothetical protein
MQLMPQTPQLPETFLRDLEVLELAYLQSDDPIEQSGFGGGAEHWPIEREPRREIARGRSGWVYNFQRIRSFQRDV